MRHVLPLVIIALSGPACSESFDRPIPQAQSATAEVWFLVASLAMIAALYGVHYLVHRK
ncbi:MAG: hypothetical protein WBC93_21610 [Sulfitobacter sp.]